MSVGISANLCATIITICIVLTGPAYGAAETTPKPILCVKQPGYIIGPVVSTAQIAKQIYIVLASVPHLHKLEGSGPLTALDEGEKWGVFHYLEQKTGISRDGQYETVEVVTGGDGLEMQIDKCSGAVLMHLGR